MPFRSIITTPEELDRLVEAFESAWTKIAPAIDPARAPAERERLARIVAELWSRDPTADLVSLAVQRSGESAAGSRSSDRVDPEGS